MSVVSSDVSSVWSEDVIISTIHGIGNDALSDLLIISGVRESHAAQYILLLMGDFNRWVLPRQFGPSCLPSHCNPHIRRNKIWTTYLGDENCVLYASICSNVYTVHWWISWGTFSKYPPPPPAVLAARKNLFLLHLFSSQDKHCVLVSRQSNHSELKYMDYHSPKPPLDSSPAIHHTVHVYLPQNVTTQGEYRK